MDSLDAQCLLIQLAEGEIRPPDLWRHDRAGALSCAYDGGERVFEWPEEAVAALARTWRASDTNRVPKQARLFLDAHQRLQGLCERGLPGPADVMIHDFGRAELRAVWKDERIVVVVEGIGAKPASLP